MGNLSLCALSLLVLLLSSPGPAVVRSSRLRVRRLYNSIVSFGDSFADTGNNPVVFSWYSVFDPATQPPYGSTFFGRPTGRCCDGRLIIDFVGCKEFFGRSLFFVGGFGFNDYSFALGEMSVQEVRSLVLDVIRTISMAIERLIKHGATSLVVPGIMPVGCAPQTLALFGSADPADYDLRTGCLRKINEVAIRHNSLLQEALHGLRAKHPVVDIVFADFFNPAMEMESPGFEGDVLTVCCGGPGRIGCGHPGATKCEDPSARLFWDDVHLTEAAYRYIADDWLSRIMKQHASQ